MSRILLVEDDPGVMAAHVRLLQLDGHNVATAATVDAAILELAAGDPELVLLDHHLDKDPSPLHDALTRRGSAVILVSGATPGDLERVALDRGWRYMAKPFSGTALRAEMQRLLEQRASRLPDSMRPATKSTAQVVGETVVDLVALGVMGAVLILRRVQAEWLQALLVVGMLLLCGVRVADLKALAQGLPTRGGVAAILFAASAAAARQLGVTS